MVLWGIDALIVVICSILVSSWDLWNFVNLSKEEQQSEMSSRNEDVNHTH